jgi:LuxR family maltose regulon positive regulatory protein
VLDRLPADLRALLVHTAILETFSAALCDAVTATAGAAARLRVLARANLFVTPLDRRGAWYRYHHLFGELLRLEVARSAAALVPLLHERAARWDRTAAPDEPMLPSD